MKTAEAIESLETRADGVETDVTDLTTSVGSVKSLIGELDDKVTAVAKLHTELNDLKKHSLKTEGEQSTLIKKMSDDFMVAISDLEELKNKMKSRRVAELNATELPNLRLKHLVTLPEVEIRARLAGNPSKADMVVEFQRLNDELVMGDALMECASRNGNGTYHRTSKGERLKSWQQFREIQEFAKAMDTATTAEGTEWIPTNFSAALHESVRLMLKVAPLFDEIPCPTKVFTLPVEGADTEAQLIGEKTTVVSGFDSDEETPPTSNLTFTASKLRSRIQVSEEITQDSIIPILPFINKHAARGLARAIDQAVINGQKTTFDTGDTIGSKDARKAWDGLREVFETDIRSTKGVSLATFNTTNLRNVRANMGKYGVTPGDMVWISSIAAYLKGFLNVTEVQTVDKYGQFATVLTGELARFDNIPIIVSELVRQDLNATGVYDNTTTTKTQVLLVNLLSWAMGVKASTSVEVVRDAINDVWTVVAFKRLDFQRAFDTASAANVIVNSGYNFTT